MTKADRLVLGHVKRVGVLRIGDVQVVDARREVLDRLVDRGMLKTGHGCWSGKQTA
ncbi:MAG: hypothetical protein KAJ19_18150 [Gammaproteobacteria bacterium]|nr:hypothetical protein [Gammaproteobacteria bacterium]